VHDRACADPRARGDYSEGTNRRTVTERDTLLDVRAWMHARLRPPRIGEQFDRAREGKIGLIGAQHRAWRGFGFVAEDHTRRARRPQFRDVAWVAEERQVTSGRVLDAGDAADVDLAVAFEAAVNALSDVFEEQWPQYTASPYPLTLT
jgi:hypothetical protein